MLRDMRSKISKSVKALAEDEDLDSQEMLDRYLFESKPSEKNPGAEDFRAKLNPENIAISI